MLRDFTLYAGIYLCLILHVIASTSARAQTNQPGETIFDDDFDRLQLGSFWNDNGGWRIVAGKAYNGVDDDWRLLTTARSFAATSYILETEVEGLVDGYQRAYYLLFGQQDDSGRPGYVLRYDPLGPGTLVLGEAGGNYLYPEVLDRAIIDLDPAIPHTFRVAKYENGLIQVYVGDGQNFPDVPTLEAIDTTHPTLSKVSWTTFTQSVGEEFFVEYVRATVPETQKTEREKPAEDELVAQINVESDNAYELGRMTEGETFYTDRPYVLTRVPDFLENARFIKTANDDKRRTDTRFLTAYVKQAAIAYVAYDPRAGQLPDWLSSWTKLDETIGTTDPGSDYFELYTRVVPFSAFGPTRYFLTLGGALAPPASGTNMNYIVALLPYEVERYEAETAFLSGPRPATNHAGFSGTGFADYINPRNDYIEWTVDVAAASPYNLVVRFANGGSAARELQLSVDGRDLRKASFGPTGRWSNWATLGLGNSLLLDAGRHTVRLTAIGTSGPNVDYLQLSPTSIYTPPAAMTALAGGPTAFNQVADYEALSVSTFPNPAVNSVLFRVAGGSDALTDLRIYDQQGREVYHERVGATAVETRRRVDVSAWPVGTYMYRLRRGEEVVTGRFVRG